MDKNWRQNPAYLARRQVEKAERLAKKKARRATPEYKAWRRARHLSSTYGVSYEVYEETFAAQGGRCAVCRRERPRLDVDHDHISGEMRGLLCRRCNLGLGMFLENPTLLIRAAKYLLSK